MTGEQPPTGGSDNLAQAIDLVTAALRALDRVTQRLEWAGLPQARAKAVRTADYTANLLSTLEAIRDDSPQTTPTMPAANAPTVAQLIEQRRMTVCQRCAHLRGNHGGHVGLGACTVDHGRPIVDPVSHQVTSICGCERFTTTPTPREGQ